MYLALLDVVSAIKHFFVTGFILKEWNSTAITRVPKTSPKSMKDFRPIASINVPHKFIAKVLSNRLHLFCHFLLTLLSLLSLKGDLYLLIFC